ncbi:hypothetical protein GBAR_LOCUS21322 [Geodia barretti]|uniref:Cilium assembly protein DZIP1 domain-containing protein n=3 Tax=Geodia barretti TaxID=519541 RepID=A0AA35X3B3_GEOBA|nr:hypothetical protein GBAR_LOCUS21322 [Geodia barretti]
MDERFHVAQHQLREELTRKENESLQSQALEFEQWKAAQQEMRKRELEEMQTPLLEQLRAVEQEKEQLQKVLLKTKAEIEAMKKLTRSPQSEDPEPSGKVKKEEGPTETADSTAVATDVKRLETKVVSKWKKHKKSVHRQMEEMNKSYQDQLLELSKKLASMEQSAKAQQFPKEKRMGKELKPKTTQQMHTQAQTVPAQQPTNANSQSEVSEGSEEEEEDEEEEEEEESEGEGGREETDAPHFTPFPNRINITTLFNHGQEAMEKIRRETANILDNALLQRGVNKGTVGMSDALLESKMKALQGDRQKRIQMHYQFMEQREHLTSEIELSAKTNCHFSPPRHLLPSSPPPPSSPSTRRSSPRRATSPFKTSPHHKTPPRLSSPQKHSPQRDSPNKQQSHGSAKPPTGLPAQAQLARSQQRVRASRPTRGSQTESSESETETESESDSESYKEDNQPAAVNTVTVAPRKRGDNGRQGAGKEVEKRGQSRVKVPAGSVRVLPDSGRTWDKGDEELQEGKARGGGMDGEDSSWDSEDSNDHLTTKDLMSVPTSTPVQVIPVKKAKVTLRVFVS